MGRQTDRQDSGKKGHTQFYIPSNWGIITWNEREPTNGLNKLAETRGSLSQGICFLYNDNRFAIGSDWHYRWPSVSDCLRQFHLLCPYFLT